MRDTVFVEKLNVHRRFVVLDPKAVMLERKLPKSPNRAHLLPHQISMEIREEFAVLSCQSRDSNLRLTMEGNDVQYKIEETLESCNRKIQIFKSGTGFFAD